MADVGIEVRGLDELQRKLGAASPELLRTLSAAGQEAGHEVIETEGLQHYPPMTAANMPPYPYYQRGLGTWTGPGNNTGSSERLGTQFYIESRGLNTAVGNRASYAPWVVGNEQASFMAPKGWRKLMEVAEEKKDRLTRIFEGWVDRALRGLGL